MWGKQTTLSANAKSSRQVVKTRRGFDKIMVDTDGPGVRKKKIDTKWVQAKDGSKWEIPYDPKTGLVPEEYLYARFLDADSGDRHGGRRRPQVDIGVTAERLHSFPNGVTPEQLIQSGWWQHPNESDIEGIDDQPGAAVARELTEAAKSAQGLGRQIVFLMPESEAARARKILAQDFNASELKRAVKRGGIVIKEGNPGRGNSGCYYSVHEDASIKTPIIILKPGWDEETLVHEFTHHLRQTDETRGGLARTPFRMNSQGERKRYSQNEAREFNSARNLEEACTVSESYIRTHDLDTDRPNGYYWRTGSTQAPKDLSKHDRSILAPEDKTLRGRRAEKMVGDKFEETSISHLAAYRPGSNAGNYYAARKAAGTMPKAQRPVRAKAQNGDAPGTTRATGGVGATASASRGGKKNKR